MPGPAPKAPGTARRRNSTTFTTLPSTGRKGKLPPWPLVDDIVMEVRKGEAESLIENLEAKLEETDSIKELKQIERQLTQARRQVTVLDKTIIAQRKLETELWNDVWSTPQAEMWENLAWDREVAQYVRWKVRGELGDLEAAKEARMWSDRLGLNPLAMLRLRWEIERAEAAEETGTRRRAAGTPSAKKPAKVEDPRNGLYAV